MLRAVWEAAMQKTLLKGVVKEEIRKRRKGISLSLIAIRKRITLAVAREITQQSPLSERYWNTFVDATEAESDLWAFLQLKDGSEVVLNAQQIQQLLSLYERWRRMCEFLIDEYDRLSRLPKGERWTKSTVLGIAQLRRFRRGSDFLRLRGARKDHLKSGTLLGPEGNHRLGALCYAWPGPVSKVPQGDAQCTMLREAASSFCKHLRTTRDKGQRLARGIQGLGGVSRCRPPSFF